MAKIRLTFNLFATCILPPLMILAIWAFTPHTPYNNGFDFDGRFYAAMAEGYSSTSMVLEHRPWNIRILTPLLASLLPFEPLSSFKAVNFISHWLSLILIFHILVLSGASKRGALLGQLFYCGVFWTIKWSFFSPAYIEAQSILFTLLILYLMLKSAYFWIIPTLAIAVLQKESAILLSPVVLMHYIKNHREGFSKNAHIYFLKLILPSLCVLALLNFFIPAEGGSYAPEALIRMVLIKRLSELNTYPVFLLSIFSGLGILPFLLIFRARKAADYLREHYYWLVMILIGIFILFCGWDTARYFVFMLPAVIVVTIQALKYCALQFNYLSLSGVILILIAHFYLGHHFDVLNSHSEYVNALRPYASSTVSANLLKLAFSGSIWILAEYLIALGLKRKN